MPLILETHRIVVNDADFVECTSSAAELRVRTSLVAHLDRNALLFIPFEVNGEQATIFYPPYHNKHLWHYVNIRELVDNVRLEPKEAVIFGTQGSYFSQPCIGVFPRSIGDTKKILNRWLNSNRLWLDKPESDDLKKKFNAHIVTKMKTILDGVNGNAELTE